MATENKKTKNSNGSADNSDFKEKMWQAADKLRRNMDPSEYKHVVLGLIFLKYISDAFEDRYQQLLQEPYADVEDRDEYAAKSVFWVPEKARWSSIQASARFPTIGKLIDEAMDAIEKDNPSLKGILVKNYARADLDKELLGGLIDLIGTMSLGNAGSRSKDILGRVYEYFLAKFAGAEGKGGGQFYTPQPVVRLLVEMLEPYKGRVYDPCCGSGGMFVQSEKFVEAHGGRIGDLSVYGQESNATTWRLCKMNLAIRGIETNLGPTHGDSFTNDLHRDLRADYILANPPFNVSDWSGEKLRDDSRWKFGVPPVSNANFAWVQHIIHHLASTGTAGFVLANGSMSSNTGGEGDIRKAIIQADLVDCMIALPSQLFYSTQIPACLWFLTRSKKNSSYRDRSGETLFIDARKLGFMSDRSHRDLSDEDIARIAATYHAWRGEPDAGPYADLPGFCKSASLEEMAGHGYILTPGRYVGAADLEDDGEPFDQKMARLINTLEEQFIESRVLEQVIGKNLRELNYEF